MGDTPLGLKLTEAAEGIADRAACTAVVETRVGESEKSAHGWTGDGGCGATRQSAARRDNRAQPCGRLKWSPCCDPVIKRVWWGGDGDQKKLQVV